MRWLMFLLLSSLIFSCKDKDVNPPEVNNIAPALAPGQVALHHDDYNMDAPELETGNYEVAVRFSGDELDELQNGNLVAVQYHMAEKPTAASIKIYMGEEITEENLVYSSSNFAAQIQRLKWNVHQLNDTIVINDQPLWIALRFTASAAQKYIGCDPGPAHAFGDWMWASSDQEWIRFENRTETSINWNIRGVVEP